MKKFLAMALSVVMMASLAGCGGGSSNGEKITLKIGMPNGASLTPASILALIQAKSVIKDTAFRIFTVNKIKNPLLNSNNVLEI